MRGLVNGGATCCIAAVLQSWRPLSALREAVSGIAEATKGRCDSRKDPILHLAHLLACLAETPPSGSPPLSLVPFLDACGLSESDRHVEFDARSVFEELLHTLLRRGGASPDSALLRRMFYFRRAARCVRPMTDEEAALRYGDGGIAREVEAEDWVGQIPIELPYLELSSGCADTLAEAFRNQVTWGHLFTHFPPVLTLFLNGAAGRQAACDGGATLSFPETIDLGPFRVDCGEEGNAALQPLVDPITDHDAWESGQAAHPVCTPSRPWWLIVAPFPPGTTLPSPWGLGTPRVIGGSVMMPRFDPAAQPPTSSQCAGAAGKGSTRRTCWCTCRATGGPKSCMNRRRIVHT
eukprot:Hpha_TRINITY_DN7881_c0_g1::TRINITY_DN7881_c0_g1_i1::g.185679::m.185679